MQAFDQHGSWEHYSNGGMLDTGIPSAANDGRVYFVTSATGQGDIHYWHRRTNALKRVTTSDAFEGNPLVSRDNEYLYFSRERAGSSEIIALHLSSRRESQVTGDKAMDTPVAELASGEVLLYSHGTLKGRVVEVQYMAIGVRGNSLSATRIGDVAVADCTGRFVLAWNDGALWRIHANDLKRRTRLSLPFSAWPMAISSDGSRIVVSKQVAAEQWTFDGDLFHVDTTNGEIVQFGVGHSVAMDSEGRTVLFSKGYGNELKLYDIDEKRDSAVMNKECPKSNLRVQSDGKSVIFSAVTGDRGSAYDIWLFDFAQEKCTLLYKVIESDVQNRLPR